MKPERQYLESQVLGATQEQLMLMLFDGAIRFSKQAKEKLAQADYETWGKLLIRAQQIMVELASALKVEELKTDGNKRRARTFPNDALITFL